MSEHHATVQWQRGEGEVFAKGRYSRVHSWRFDGGAQVRASSSPHVVSAPWSDPAAVDPEEGYVAALSSCHMLWFLSLAAAAGFVVESYEDEAVGQMSEVRPRRRAVTQVILRPRVIFDPAHTADATQLQALHDEAHDHCFLANSVKTEIRIEPR